MVNRAEKRRQKKLADKAASKTKPDSSPNSSPNQPSPAIQQSLDLAMGHHAAGDLPKAEGLYRQILQTDPKQPVALHLLGVIAHQVGSHAAAVDLISQAIAVKPDFADAHCNLGLVLQDMGRLDDAVASYQQALATAPDSAVAHCNLGIALKVLGNPEDAVAHFRKAITLTPDYAEAHNNLGNALKDLGQTEDAAPCYRKALALKPDYADAHYNLGNALEDQGNLSGAVDHYQKAIAAKPDYALAHSNLLVTMVFLSTVTTADVFEASKRAGTALEQPFVGHSVHHGNTRDPDRVLKVGYLSPSLTGHVLAPYLEPVLTAHRRDRVAVHVYAHVANPDDTTWRLKELADHWTFVNDLSDDALAARIVEDGIDILVDPMGHWSSNRLAVFARKPAPVQVSYLCQNITTGLTQMDYVIADRWLGEGGVMQSFATEQVVELDGGFQTTGYDHETPIMDTPAAQAGFITFGSFNNPVKISDLSLVLWASVLDAVPTARMLIKGGKLERPDNRAAMMQRLEDHGIAPKRIDLRGFVLEGDHLEVHNEVDIALDTAPFGGGRTTVDALWMGVPVVSLVGDAVYGRYSYSHLNRVGVPELAAHSEQEFRDIAVNLAGDPARLKHYRETLRPMMQASPLLDAELHVHELEQAYTTMWRRWCAGKEPGGFRVSGAGED